MVLALLFAELVTLLVAILITILVSIPITAAATWLERMGCRGWSARCWPCSAWWLRWRGWSPLLLPTFMDQSKEFIDAVPGIVDDLEREVADVTGDEPGEVSEKIQDRLEGIVRRSGAARRADRRHGRRPGGRSSPRPCSAW